DDGPKRDVGDEMAVHDVDVDHVATDGLDRLDLLAKPRKIGREDRGRDADGGRHGGHRLWIRTSHSRIWRRCIETGTGGRPVVAGVGVKFPVGSGDAWGDGGK